MGIREAYLRPKPFESEELYKKLGAHLYNKHINVNSSANKHSWAAKYREWRDPNGELGSLPNGESHLERIKRFEKTSERNELRHLGGLGLNCAAELVMQKLDAPVRLRLANAAMAVGYNLYPILVQRYNRLRTNETIQRIEARQARNSSEV